MSSPGFRSDAAAAAAAAAEGPAPGPPGERPLMPVTDFGCGKPYWASEAVAGGVPGKLQDEGLPPPVGKAAERAEDRRPAGAAALAQGQGTAYPTFLLLAQSFGSAASPSPSGSQLTTVGTLHNPSQPGQDGAQEVGAETESLPLTGTLLFKVEEACDGNRKHESRLPELWIGVIFIRRSWSPSCACFLTWFVMWDREKTPLISPLFCPYQFPLATISSSGYHISKTIGNWSSAEEGEGLETKSFQE